MMRYSVQQIDQIFVNGNGQKNILIMLHNLQQTRLKLFQKKAIQKTAKATGDLIGNKIAGKLQKFKKSTTR